MSDQTQQSGGATQSNPSASNKAANTTKSSNPWEGTPDPGESGEQVTTQGQGEAQEQGSEGQQGSSAAQTTEAQSGATTTTKPTSGAATAAGLSPEDISAIVAKTVGASVQAALPRQEQQQPQFTDEQFRETFKVFQPTPELLAKIGLPATPEGAAVFQNEVVTPIIRQALAMNAFQITKMKNELMDHLKTSLQPYEGARQMAMQQQEAKLKEEFMVSNPDLKGYEPLLTEIYTRLASQGKQFKDKDEAFKTVADQARAVIKQLPGLNGGQQTETTQTKGTTGGASRMSGLSGSGQGAANTGNGAGRKKNTAETLFGG